MSFKVIFIFYDISNIWAVSHFSPAAALNAAKAGLDFCYNNFDFVDQKGSVSKFSEYIANASSYGTFHSYRIDGTGKKGGSPLYLSYKGKRLEGDDMKNQLKKWADYGTVEPDVADSINAVSGNVDLSGKTFVLIGAGSAMGPYYKLLEHGATVVCVDMPGDTDMPCLYFAHCN